MQTEIIVDTRQAEQNVGNLKNAFVDLWKTSNNTPKDMFSDVKPIDMAGGNISFNPIDDSLKTQDEFAHKLSTVNNLFGMFQQDIIKTSEVLKAFFENQKKNEQKPQEPQLPSGKKEKNKQNESAKNIINATQNASNITKTALSGDPLSATISAGTQLSKGMIDKGTDANGGLNFLGGLGVGSLVATVLAGTANAGSKQYENALSELDTILTNFGKDIEKRSGALNASQAVNLRSIVAEKSIGTGLDIPTFANYMTTFSRQGVTDIEKAGALTQAAAGWNRYTGADIGAVTGFMGTVERFGGNSREAMLNAYNASVSSGLDKTQFSEFLTGIQRVMEDGIAKGFVRSTEDVATSLSTLASISGGNKLWQGEQGARRYQQMAQGLAGMTGLNSTSSMLTYRVMAEMLGENDVNAEKMLGKNNYIKGGSVFNELALMQKGDITPEFISTLRTVSNNMFGGDIDAKIGQYKEMFGLNDAGAIQLYNFIHESGLSDKDIAKKASELKETPSMLSDATKLQDSMNRLSDSLVKSTQPLFKMKFGALETIDGNVDKISNMISANMYGNSLDTLLADFFDDYEKEEKKQAKKELYNMLVSSDPETVAEANKIVERLGSMTAEEKAFVNANNLLSDNDGVRLPSSVGKNTRNSLKETEELLYISDEGIRNSVINATNRGATDEELKPVLNAWIEANKDAVLTKAERREIIQLLEGIRTNTDSIELQ